MAAKFHCHAETGVCVPVLQNGKVCPIPLKLLSSYVSRRKAKV